MVLVASSSNGSSTIHRKEESIINNDYHTSIRYLSNHVQRYAAWIVEVDTDQEQKLSMFLAGF